MSPGSDNVAEYLLLLGNFTKLYGSKPKILFSRNNASSESLELWGFLKARNFLDEYLRYVLMDILNELLDSSKTIED